MEFTGARSAPKTPFCRPGESQDPRVSRSCGRTVIPAFAGMNREVRPKKPSFASLRTLCALCGKEFLLRDLRASVVNLKL